MSAMEARRLAIIDAVETQPVDTSAEFLAEAEAKSYWPPLMEGDMDNWFTYTPHKLFKVPTQIEKEIKVTQPWVAICFYIRFKRENELCDVFFFIITNLRYAPHISIEKIISNDIEIDIPDVQMFLFFRGYDQTVLLNPSDKIEVMVSLNDIFFHCEVDSLLYKEIKSVKGTIWLTMLQAVHVKMHHDFRANLSGIEYCSNFNKRFDVLFCPASGLPGLHCDSGLRSWPYESFSVRIDKLEEIGLLLNGSKEHKSACYDLFKHFIAKIPEKPTIKCIKTSIVYSNGETEEISSPIIPLKKLRFN